MKRKLLLVWNEAYSKALFRCLSEEKEAEEAAALAVKQAIASARAEEQAKQESAATEKGVQS